MRLTQPVQQAAGTSFVTFGPFGPDIRRVTSVIIGFYSTGAASEIVPIQAAVTDGRATAAADVDGGDQLFGGSGGTIGIFIDVSREQVQVIPVDAGRIRGRYVGIEMVTADTVDGWIGLGVHYGAD